MFRSPWDRVFRNMLLIAPLCGLLAACGGASASTGYRPSGGATPSATAAATPPTIIATVIASDSSTATPMSAPQNPSPTSTGMCAGVFGPGAPSVYAFSQSVYAQALYRLAYPSYKLPNNTPLAPYKINNVSSDAALAQQFGGVANTNPDTRPGGIVVTVCNDGSQSITLTGISMGILAMTPYSGSVNTWQPCDGAYQPGTSVSSGGCGGGFSADEVMQVTFPAGAGVGASAAATQVSVTGVNANGYGPLPVTLKPQASIVLSVGVTMPTSAGTYSLGVTIDASGVTGPTIYAPLPPQLFAPVAHKWTGAACATSAMQAQIPTSSTSYYICPQM